MKKILESKELLQQFINDKSILQQKQLSKKYSISLSIVYRLVKKLKSPEQSQNQSQEQSQEQSQQQSPEQSQEQSPDQSQNQSLITQNSEQQQSENNEQTVEEQPSSNSIEEIQQEEQIIDKSLINYLNKPNDSVEIQRNKKEKMQKTIIEKPQIIQQPQQIIIQQPIQQIDLQQNGEDESEIKNYMVKIRKFIQFFSKEESIFHIIGSNEFQQRQFISRLYLKNLEEIKLIHKTIQFELLFSRSNSFMQDTIESSALFIERLLLSLDINVVGCFQELQEDEEFQFYYYLMLCDNAFIASAKQIIFMKFIKNYYKKFSENKSNTSIDFKQKLKEQANKDLLEKFNRL